MNLQEFSNIDQIDESFGSSYKVSKKANKLIKRLEEKEKDFQNKLSNSKLPITKRRELKEKLFAIEKTKPVLKKFEQYFLKLEKAMDGMSDKDKIKKIKSKYDEINQLFISKLYYAMKLVGYNASLIIASIIASMIVTSLATIFIPGSTLAIAIPGILLIKKLQEQKIRIHNKKFSKEIDFLIKKLESKKKKTLQYY